jgi:Tfp pilus assembly protein PilN
LLFQRGAAVAQPRRAPPPPAVGPDWIDRAWLAGPSTVAFARLSPRQLAAALVLVAALALAWRAGEAMALNLVDARLARAQAREGASLGGLEAARRNALADLDAVQAVAQLDRFPSQLALLAAIVQRLPEDARIVEWNWQNGELSFTASAPEPADLPATVRALSSVPLLTNVVADRSLDGRGVVVRCRVRA